MALAEHLANLAKEGPIAFRDWMDACLTGPGGYYTKGRVTGTDSEADFATSPTLHPFFGEAIGKEIEACWAAAGKPATWTVVEFGGGEGDLARGAQESLSKEARSAVRWIHVDASPHHRTAQADTGSHAPAAPEGTDFVVANEFVDVLPFHVLDFEGGWRELAVAGPPWTETHITPSPEALACLPVEAPAAGTRAVAMADAKVWLEDVAAVLRPGGSVLIVDYGDEGRHLWNPTRGKAAVRGYRKHALVSPLEAPGDTDITCSVDFSMLRRWAKDVGWTESVYETQEAFLLRHGILEALNATPRDTPEGASAYLRLRQLLLPTGLGHAFRVQRFTSA